jgi:hypothetical protein
MDKVAKEILLNEFGELFAKAYDYAVSEVTNSVSQMDTASHPRFAALEEYLSERDETVRLQKFARYAMQVFAFNLLQSIDESEKFDIVMREEGHSDILLSEVSELLAQEADNWCRMYSDYGSAISEVGDIYDRITRQPWSLNPE